MQLSLKTAHLSVCHEENNALESLPQFHQEQTKPITAMSLWGMLHDLGCIWVIRDFKGPLSKSIKVLQNMTGTGRQWPGGKAFLSYKILIFPSQMILSALQSLLQLFLELFLVLGNFFVPNGMPRPSML